jgi:hypothetical protein
MNNFSKKKELENQRLVGRSRLKPVAPHVESAWSQRLSVMDWLQVLLSNSTCAATAWTCSTRASSCTTTQGGH